MRVVSTAVQAEKGPATEYTLYKENNDEQPIGTALLQGCELCGLSLQPQWRGKGYGSFFLKEILRQGGGFDPHAPSLFTAPMPDAQNAAALALAAKYDFVCRNAILCRARTPDLTAVEFTHRFLAQALQPGGFYLDATCGNGHDTLFLCKLAGATGRVLGLDIQPEAVQATNARLEEAGMASVGHAIVADHAELARYIPPQGADCVLFNFGWLPGGNHEIHSDAAGSLPALQAALDALHPGGVLAAVLYSGKVIGSGEKEAALQWMQALPLARYTVLVCQFANWAQTAPLPCFVLKKQIAPP